MHPQVALTRNAFSKDGNLLAYAFAAGGSDWNQCKVMKVDQDAGTATDLDDVLKHVKFSSLAWTHDHKVRRYTHVPVQCNMYA